MTVERFQVVPAAYLFLRRGSDVLLQLREGTGFMDGHWAAAAAGHVEADESVFDAIIREAREELGIEVDSADLTPVTALQRTQRNHQAVDERVDFFFECRTWNSEPALQEPEKAADLGWFSLSALPHPVVPHEKYVLDLMAGGNPPAIVSFGFSPG